MKFRSIPALAIILFIFAGFAGCGQSPKEVRRTGDGNQTQPAPSTQTVEGGPIDRHVSRLILTRHARCRMDCRHITEKELREVLEEGEINYRKSEPDAHPDPKYAMEGYTKEGQHLRIVFAVPGKKRGDGTSLVVVTCIELGVEWQCDCR